MFWLKRNNITVSDPRTPPDTIIYAIGDIHGSLEPLMRLHEKIEIDSDKYNEKHKILVYLGDYIDRGVNSSEVIDLLINNPLRDFKKIYLKGNHEHALLSFLENSENSREWFTWGGDSTVMSYGASFYDEMNNRFSYADIRNNLARLIPQTHYEFYRNLKISHIEGDYMFVHAGLKPKVLIENQSDLDMITIRDEFVSCNKKFSKKIVFGHTIFKEPYIDDVKIGIDTGAYLSGKLSCVVLEDDNVRFISSND